MTKDDVITDVQHARVIVNKFGEYYQRYVVDKLQGVSQNNCSDKDERQAEKIIGYMENEYALNVANVLWKDKFDDIPQWIRDYGDNS